MNKLRIVVLSILMLITFMICWAFGDNSKPTKIDSWQLPIVIGPSSGDIILSGEYRGGGTTVAVRIKEGYRGTIRFDGVLIDYRWNSHLSTPVLLEPGADCTIELVGKRSVLAAGRQSEEGISELDMGGCAAIYVPKGAKLRLSGSGRLIARGGDGAYFGGGGAGIGGQGGKHGISRGVKQEPTGEPIRFYTPLVKGEDGHDCGEVIISANVNVEAYGGNSLSAGGAGIGGGGGGVSLGVWQNGKGGDGGVLTILGNVTAVGGSNERPCGGGGAGIGGGGSLGMGGNSCVVNILGNANVNSTGGGGATDEEREDGGGGGGSGIGGGGGGGVLDTGSSGNGFGITISGNAKVNAVGGAGYPSYGGSGIGGGGMRYGSGGTCSVHIAGGTISATRGKYGSADDIGRGSGDNNTVDHPKPIIIIINILMHSVANRMNC
jgi:hypothetical protein